MSTLRRFIVVPDTATSRAEVVSAKSRAGVHAEAGITARRPELDPDAPPGGDIRPSLEGVPERHFDETGLRVVSPGVVGDSRYTWADDGGMAYFRQSPHVVHRAPALLARSETRYLVHPKLLPLASGDLACVWIESDWQPAYHRFAAALTSSPQKVYWSKCDRTSGRWSEPVEIAEVSSMLAKFRTYSRYGAGEYGLIGGIDLVQHPDTGEIQLLVAAYDSALANPVAIEQERESLQASRWRCLVSFSSWDYGEGWVERSRSFFNGSAPDIYLWIDRGEDLDQSPPQALAAEVLSSGRICLAMVTNRRLWSLVSDDRGASWTPHLVASATNRGGNHLGMCVARNGVLVLSWGTWDSGAFPEGPEGGPSGHQVLLSANGEEWTAPFRVASDVMPSGSSVCVGPDGFPHFYGSAHGAYDRGGIHVSFEGEDQVEFVIPDEVNLNEILSFGGYGGGEATVLSGSVVTVEGSLMVSLEGFAVSGRGGSTREFIYFKDDRSDLDRVFNDWTIEIDGEVRRIVAYDGEARRATLDEPLPRIPPPHVPRFVGDSEGIPYTLRAIRYSLSVDNPGVVVPGDGQLFFVISGGSGVGISAPIMDTNHPLFGFPEHVPELTFWIETSPDYGAPGADSEWQIVSPAEIEDDENEVLQPGDGVSEGFLTHDYYYSSAEHRRIDYYRGWTLQVIDGPASGEEFDILGSSPRSRTTDWSTGENTDGGVLLSHDAMNVTDPKKYIVGMPITFSDGFLARVTEVNEDEKYVVFAPARAEEFEQVAQSIRLPEGIKIRFRQGYDQGAPTNESTIILVGTNPNSGLRVCDANRASLADGGGRVPHDPVGLKLRLVGGPANGEEYEITGRAVADQDLIDALPAAAQSWVQVGSVILTVNPPWSDAVKFDDAFDYRVRNPGQQHGFTVHNEQTRSSGCLIGKKFRTRDPSLSAVEPHDLIVAPEAVPHRDGWDDAWGATQGRYYYAFHRAGGSPAGEYLSVLDEAATAPQHHGFAAVDSVRWRDRVILVASALREAPAVAGEGQPGVGSCSLVALQVGGWQSLQELLPDASPQRLGDGASERPDRFPHYPFGGFVYNETWDCYGLPDDWGWGLVGEPASLEMGDEGGYLKIGAYSQSFYKALLQKGDAVTASNEDPGVGVSTSFRFVFQVFGGSSDEDACAIWMLVNEGTASDDRAGPEVRVRAWQSGDETEIRVFSPADVQVGAATLRAGQWIELLLGVSDSEMSGFVGDDLVPIPHLTCYARTWDRNSDPDWLCGWTRVVGDDLTPYAALALEDGKKDQLPFVQFGNLSTASGESWWKSVHVARGAGDDPDRFRVGHLVQVSESDLLDESSSVRSVTGSGEAKIDSGIDNQMRAPMTAYDPAQFLRDGESVRWRGEAITPGDFRFAPGYVHGADNVLSLPALRDWRADVDNDETSIVDIVFDAGEGSGFGPDAVAMFGRNFPAFDLAFGDDKDPSDVIVSFKIPDVAAGGGAQVHDTSLWRFAPSKGGRNYSYSLNGNRLTVVDDDDDSVHIWTPHRFKSSPGGRRYFLAFTTSEYSEDISPLDENDPGGLVSVFEIEDNTANSLILKGSAADITAGATHIRVVFDGEQFIGVPEPKKFSIFSDSFVAEIGDSFSVGQSFRYMKISIGHARMFCDDGQLRLGHMMVGRAIDLDRPNPEWGWTFGYESGNEVTARDDGAVFSRRMRPHARTLSMGFAIVHPPSGSDTLDKERGRRGHHDWTALVQKLEIDGLPVVLVLDPSAAPHEATAPMLARVTNPGSVEHVAYNCDDDSARPAARILGIVFAEEF